MKKQDTAKEATERKPGGDTGVPGESGALAHASFQIPSSMGTQELVTEKTSRDDEKSSKIVTTFAFNKATISQNWKLGLRRL